MSFVINDKPEQSTLKCINMSEINKEDPKSGFLKERFLRAVNASKEKLNQAIQYRQEREAVKMWPPNLWLIKPLKIKS